MKKLRILAVVIIAVLIMTTVAFAEQSTPGTTGGTDGQHGWKSALKDPIQALQDMKTRIQKSLTAGKITQDQADKQTAAIDQKIKAQQDFDSMTLQQKKDKLVSDFTASINKMVQAGKLAQDKADKMIADYKAKVDSWDGTGNAPFGKMAGAFGERGDVKGMGQGKAPKAGNTPTQDPIQMLQNMKTKIQQSVTDGKITQAQADKEIAAIDQKIKAMQDFNNLTLQQKKDKLVSDFTASVNKMVQAGKLAQDKADQLIANYKTKIDNWDGTGYPAFANMSGMFAQNGGTFGGFGKGSPKMAGKRPMGNFKRSGTKAPAAGGVPTSGNATAL